MKIISRSNSIFISICYTICFLYYLLFQYFTFSPVISITRTSNYSEEFYFENNLGGLLWECDQREKIIFYFNDWNGNCSTRIGYIRQLQKHIPEYFFIQLEYPGYGYSSHLELSINGMIEKCGECIVNYVKKNNIQFFGLWGEGMGNIILSKVIKYYPIKPNFIIHYNLVPSMNKYMFQKYSFISLLFILSVLNIEDYSNRLQDNIPNIYLLHNEEKNVKKYSYEFYYYLSKIPFSKKNIISLKGEGISSYFLTKNISRLQKKIV